MKRRAVLAMVVVLTAAAGATALAEAAPEGGSALMKALRAKAAAAAKKTATPPKPKPAPKPKPKVAKSAPDAGTPAIAKVPERGADAGIASAAPQRVPDAGIASATPPRPPDAGAARSAVATLPARGPDAGTSNSLSVRAPDGGVQRAVVRVLERSPDAGTPRGLAQRAPDAGTGRSAVASTPAPDPSSALFSARGRPDAGTGRQAVAAPGASGPQRPTTVRAAPPRAGNPRARLSSNALPTGERASDLPPSEKLRRSTDYLGRMRGILKEVLAKLDDARAAKDVVKLNCVNHKLIHVKGLLRISEQSDVALQEAVARKESASADHEYTKIAIAKQKVDQLRGEAEECIGQLAYRTDENLLIEVDVPDDLPGLDPTQPEQLPDVVLQLPMASPVL